VVWFTGAPEEALVLLHIGVWGSAGYQMDICSHMMPVGRASIVCTCMARDLRVARLNQTLLPVWACFGMD
jgi:hypothetical protein